MNKSANSAMIDEARTLEKAGCVAEAARIYDKIIRKDRSNAEALKARAYIAVRTGRLHDAADLFEKAARARPGDLELEKNLASLSLAMHRPDLAVEHATAALAADGHDIEALRTAGESHHRMDRPDEARNLLERASALAPADDSIRLEMARCLDTCGDVEGARAIYRKLIEGPSPLTNAIDGYLRLERHSEPPPELAVVERLLAGGRLPPRERMVLGLAAGKVCQDLGRFDEAWRHFAAARAGQPKLESRNDLPGRVPAMASAFSREFFAKNKSTANPSDKPVFVFGMPRSGTSLVEQILASHPDAHGCGEQFFLHAEANRLLHEAGGASALTRTAGKWAGTAKSIASGYLDLLAAYAPSAGRAVDKMPHNFEILWFLALAFPRATFIHVRRNAMDTCVSCFAHPLGPYHRYVNDLTTLGKYYRAYRALMEHWKSALPVDIVEVDYESLVGDIEGESRRLIAAAGLDWSDECLDFHRARRPVRTLSRRQVEQPVYPHAIGSWRRYKPYVGDLRKALGDLAESGEGPPTATEP